MNADDCELTKEPPMRLGTLWMKIQSIKYHLLTIIKPNSRQCNSSVSRLQQNKIGPQCIQEIQVCSDCGFFFFADVLDH